MKSIVAVFVLLLVLERRAGGIDPYITDRVDRYDDLVASATIRYSLVVDMHGHVYAPTTADQECSLGLQEIKNASAVKNSIMEYLRLHQTEPDLDGIREYMSESVEFLNTTIRKFYKLRDSLHPVQRPNQPSGITSTGDPGSNADQGGNRVQLPPPVSPPSRYSDRSIQQTQPSTPAHKHHKAEAVEQQPEEQSEPSTPAHKHHKAKAVEQLPPSATPKKKTGPN
jgi:hypothetical protein